MRGKKKKKKTVHDPKYSMKSIAHFSKQKLICSREQLNCATHFFSRKNPETIGQQVGCARQAQWITKHPHQTNSKDQFYGQGQPTHQIPQCHHLHLVTREREASYQQPYLTEETFITGLGDPDLCLRMTRCSK